MPIASAEGELPGGTGGFFEGGEGVDEADVILAGMLQTGDVEEKGFVETVPGFCPGLGSSGLPGWKRS